MVVPSSLYLERTRATIPAAPFPLHMLVGYPEGEAPPSAKPLGENNGDADDHEQSLAHRTCLLVRQYCVEWARTSLLGATHVMPANCRISPRQWLGVLCSGCAGARARPTEEGELSCDHSGAT
jgi:hypothetical protein